MSEDPESRDQEMKFHCLGVGAIGSLLATNLAQLPSAEVRLILKRASLASALQSCQDEEGEALPTDNVNRLHAKQSVYLRMERAGLSRRVGGLGVELSSSDNSSYYSSSTSAHQSSKYYDNLVRHDKIDTLIITTKAQNTLPALKPFLPRLTSSSTIVLCQNGMGVLEGLLETYWPSDLSYNSTNSRPSFVCATTSHGVWRKGPNHFVHAGMGDIRFGIVPNKAALDAILSHPKPTWGLTSNNPILNPRSLTAPSLTHLPPYPQTRTLRESVSSLLSCPELHSSWLPLPTLQIAQLQKLAVNTGVNALTAILGVHNGAIVGSQLAKGLISDIMEECGKVFAAHLAMEEGRWVPPMNDQRTTPPIPSRSSSTTSSSNNRFSFPDDLYDTYDNQLKKSHPPPPPLPTTHPLSTHNLTDYTLRVLFKNSSNLSSTLQDLLRTTSSSPSSSTSSSPFPPTNLEIDFINGYIVALGERYGISTPVTRSLGQLAKLKEEMIRSGAIDRVYETRLQKDLEREERGRKEKERQGSIFSGKGTEERRKSLASSPEGRRDKFLEKRRSWEIRDKVREREKREEREER